MAHANRKKMKLSTDLIEERDQSQLDIAELDLSQPQLEQHQSLESIMQELDVHEQKVLLRIKELNKLCSDFQDELCELTKQLDEIANKTNCSLCLGQCESAGEHCLVSLPCGHLFGEHCICQHLAMNTFCPCCNQVAYPGDVHRLLGDRTLPASGAQPDPSQADL